LHPPDWREPVLLLAATLDETKATELVRCILDAKSPYEQELHRDLLLAGECLSSGVRVGAELRHVLLDRLLRLYLRGIENPWTDPERTAFQQLVVQPIETILGSLGEEDRAEILPSLLAIARGEDRSVRITLGKVAACLARKTREFVYSIPLFLYDLVYHLVRQPILPITRPIIFPPYLKFISPAYLRELQAEAITYWRSVALKALGNLKFGGPEITSLLLEALDNVSLRGVAAEVLGKVGPGTPEVVMALVNAQRQHRHAYGWDKTVEKIVEALGVLGQRHPEVVELLLDIVSSPEPESHLPDVHYPVTVALCKAAETSPRAMAFVLEGWRRLYATQIMPDGAIVKVLDEGVREGLKDGRKEMIKSASPEVIQYLLDAIWESDDPRMPDTAGEFLARVVGDTPLVQCKVVEKDGTVRYRTRDLTEEVFDVFLRRPYQASAFGNVALSLLVRWGLNRPELIVRLINTVREADIGILASIIEGHIVTLTVRLSVISEDTERAFEEQLKRLGVDEAARKKWVMNEERKRELENTIALLRRSAALLRSPNKAVREAEFNAWLAAARSVPEGGGYLAPELLAAVVRTKPQILNNAYGLMCGLLWDAHERSWTRQPTIQVNPYVLAALACFRGWNMMSYVFVLLTTEEVQEEFSSKADQALSILQNPGRQAVEVLASILAGEGAKLANNLEQRLQLEDELLPEEMKRLDSWHEESKPSFTARSAAAYALAQLAGDYPEAQAVLLSNLKPPFWRRGSGFHPETEFQEHLIRALGYVRNANCDLVSTLLDIAARHDEDVYRAGSDALSRLQNPSPKAVSLLLERYKELNKWGRACLIKALGTFLGTVEPPISKAVEEVVEKVVDRLLSALKDKDQHVRSAAAKGLGNLREPQPKVIDALLGCLSHNLAAVEAIGRLTDRILLTDSASARAWLVRIARALWRARQRSLPSYDPEVGRSGDDVFYEALNRVVARLTELEVAALPADLPLPGKSEVPVVTRLHPISPGLIAIGAIVSTILGLVSNIMATYLQERYHLITDPIRLIVVVAVFLVSLAASIGLSWRAARERDGERK
jgi:HEAT repeat protein